MNIDSSDSPSNSEPKTSETHTLRFLESILRRLLNQLKFWKKKIYPQILAEKSLHNPRRKLFKNGQSGFYVKSGNDFWVWNRDLWACAKVHSLVQIWMFFLNLEMKMEIDRAPRWAQARATSVSKSCQMIIFRFLSMKIGARKAIFSVHFSGHECWFIGFAIKFWA